MTIEACPPAYRAAPKITPAGTIDASFEQQHESFLKRGKSVPIGLLFLGDSITQAFVNMTDIYGARYAQYHPANFGISGDRTEHLLWRIENGELDGIDPTAIVLLIGTNNIGNPKHGDDNIGYPVDDIIQAHRRMVAVIHEKLPHAKLLLIGIFPRGMDPSVTNVARMRDRIATVNASMATLEDRTTTFFLDLGERFLGPGGIIPPENMPDALHLSHEGYRIWADAMQPLLDKLMS